MHLKFVAGDALAPRDVGSDLFEQDETSRRT